MSLDDSGHPRSWATGAGKAAVRALMDANTQEDKELGQRAPAGESGLRPRAWPKVQGAVGPLLTPVPLPGVRSPPIAEFLNRPIENTDS